MSTSIDNITLALISLKNELEDYLDSNGWKRKYQIYLSGDDNLIGKEIVLNVKSTRIEIGLPLIVLETGFARNEIVELGNESGQDFVELTAILIARDAIQLITLGNVFRRKLDDLVYNIKDYSTNNKVVGTAEIHDATMQNISNLASDHVADRHVAVITAELELTASDLI